MASWAVLGVPASIVPVTMMSAASTSKGEKKGGLFDWLTDVLDKSSLSETDPVLQRADLPAPPPRPSAAPKKPSPPPPKKQGGGGFFGLGKK